MITLYITNNSASIYTFKKRAQRLVDGQPKLPIGETKKIENVSDQDMLWWADDIATLQASASFDVTIIDDFRRTAQIDGNLNISDALSIGSATRPFNQVTIEGNLTFSAAQQGKLYAHTLNVTGNATLNGTDGQVGAVVNRAHINGNLTITEGTHEIAGCHVGGNLACGAGGTFVGEDLFVQGTSTVTAGGSVTTSAARCIGVITGTITNAAARTIS